MIYKIKQQMKDLHARAMPHVRKMHAKVRPHWRKIMLFGGTGLLALTIIFQIFYPSNRLVFFTTIDGVSFSGWQKSDASRQLNKRYMDTLVPVYFGKANKAYISPKLSEIGLIVNNQTRINKIDYPWYLRIVPTSILWAHFITEYKTVPDYQRNDKTLVAFITNNLGTSCDVKPQDASLKASGKSFSVVPSANGGTCEVKTVHKMLADTKPQLKTNYRVTIPVKEIAPSVSDKMARQFGDDLQKKAGSGVALDVNGSPQIIPTTDLFGWMDFSSVEGKLTYVLNVDRASVYLNKVIAPKVAVNAGVTTVSTYDFVETSRVNGPSGKKLDVGATLGSLKAFMDGASDKATALTAPVAPRITYTRSYSPTDVGLSALMQQYAQDHPGVYGVSMIELSGKSRRASYNDTKSFTTASTYKLFVAYSTLRRIEDGSWHWTDQITVDRNLSVCFDDMIVKSDNACATAMLTKVGFSNITNEARAIGCTSTSFLGKDGIKTTSADLALFLAQLQTGQILSQQSSRDRLLSDMKRNVYRQGIPAGLGGSVVADKVGFMDGLLHDASIVYSPNGTYVLVIMTDGSSWATIADFARQIEALRIQ